MGGTRRATDCHAVNWKRPFLWLYAFVQPQTGETYWWILKRSRRTESSAKAFPRPYVNTKLFNRVLADFAREFGAGKNKHIILTMDQAGWHTSEQVEVLEGIHLEFMPSHSPEVCRGEASPRSTSIELQPAERLWPLTNEPIANRTFDNLEELEEVLFHRCLALLKQPDLIAGLTCFHWWPRVVA